MGLDHWFEQQLHPASIDETDLSARLARFPAMQWNLRDLLFRAPANPIVRQAADGRASIPSNGTLHAVYENAIYRMQERKEAKSETAAAAQQNAAPAASAQPSAAAMEGSAAPANNGQAAPDAQAMALAARMDTLDDDPQTDTILALPPEQRVARLTAMQPAEFESFIKSLRPVQRQALVADMPPELRETRCRSRKPRAAGRRRVDGRAPYPRHLLECAAAGSDDRLLAQSLQHLSAQKRDDALLPGRATNAT